MEEEENLFKVVAIKEAVPLHAMRAMRREAYSSYSFLTSALDGCEWSASAAIYTEGKDPRYPL
jgi:hypothetical protein